MNFSEFKSTYEKISVEEFPNRVPKNVTVSVCVQTYQHENYIEECLNSILEQQTNFDFEILLGEDASSDKTREICINFAKKHPTKIRLFLHHRENNIRLNNKPSGRFNLLYNFYNANGKYVALCEGDDYWTNHKKLQIQTDFLEENQQYDIVGHLTQETSENNQTYRFIKPNTGELNFKKVIKLGYPIHTTSFFFRKNRLNDYLNLSYFESYTADRPLLYYMAYKKPLYVINQYMSVYRHNDFGFTKSKKKVAPQLFKFNDVYALKPVMHNIDFKNKLFLKKQLIIVYLKRLYSYYKNQTLSFRYFFNSTLELFKFLIK